MRANKCRGLSVWLFSKIVMLVFLFLVFGTVMGFVRIVNEKVSADSAETLASQVKNGVQSILETTAVAASTVVPLPKTLPSETAAGTIPETSMKYYSLKIFSPTSSLVAVAVSWDTPPTTFVAASSYASSSSIGTLFANSIDHHFITVSMNSSGHRICRCNQVEGCPSTAPNSKDCCISSSNALCN